MKQLLLIFSGVLLTGSMGFAQQRGILSNFMMNDYYYNPAIAGSKPVQTANLSYRNQYVGFDGAPSLIMGNYNGSIKNLGKIGFGASVVSETTGLTNMTGVYGTYAYHFKLSKKLKLGLGVQPGFMQYRVKLYDAQVADAGDEVLTGSVYSANALDLSSGFNLYSESFFVMASMHHMLGKGIQFTGYNDNLQFHYNMIAGYNIKFKKSKFELQPSAMIKYTKPVPFQFTGMLKGTFNDKYWIGFLYRQDDAAGAVLGAKIKERISISYGYDYTISGLRKYQSGSHEITLSFVIKKDVPTIEEEDEELNKSILEKMEQERNKKDQD